MRQVRIDAKRRTASRPTRRDFRDDIRRSVYPVERVRYTSSRPSRNGNGATQTFSAARQFRVDVPLQGGLKRRRARCRINSSKMRKKGERRKVNRLDAANAIRVVAVFSFYFARSVREIVAGRSGRGENGLCTREQNNDSTETPSITRTVRAPSAREKRRPIAARSPYHLSRFAGLTRAT